MTEPIPGQTWAATVAGGGLRIVCVDPDPATVSYRTLLGLHRCISLAEWRAWVNRWKCEVIAK
jgi:hypothetical protein